MEINLKNLLKDLLKHQEKYQSISNPTDEVYELDNMNDATPTPDGESILSFQAIQQKMYNFYSSMRGNYPPEETKY